jgi:hypothetical protein
VSRLRARAVDRLTAALRGLLRDAVRERGGTADGLWSALRSAVERRMANPDPGAPLPSREGRPHAT